MIRKVLDCLYVGSGAIAALLIAAICLLVSTQVLFNLITRFGGGSVNLTIPSYGDFAGYFLAASSFLALAYTLTRGGHIRVNLMLTRLPSRAQWLAEILSLSICTVLSAYVTSIWQCSVWSLTNLETCHPASSPCPCGYHKVLYYSDSLF